MSKKLSVAVIAAVLVLAICVTGTIAYLTARSNGGTAIKNTFVASKGLIEDPDPDQDPTKNGFFILETDKDGEITKTGNAYTVMPGVNLKKDAYVHTLGKTEVPAYVFIQVHDTLDAKLTYAITDDWIDTGLTVENGEDDEGTPILDKVYVYKTVIDDDIDVDILVNKEVVVDKDYDAEDGGELSFNGYLCQEEGFTSESGFKANAVKAFTACFIED